MTDSGKKTDRTPLLDLGPDQILPGLTGTLTALGEKPYRARQIARQVYQRGLLDFDRMTDLPTALREKLTAAISLLLLEPVREVASRDGTSKTLWQARDGGSVESVIIPMERGHTTVCLSVQTGCALGCAFCATGRLGAGRNLSTGEILVQALHPLSRLGLAAPGADKSRAPNYVFMGMGEPFLNYDNLACALRVMNHNDLMQVGARRITVSTVGLPDRMIEFSMEFPQMKLAVSLHTVDEGLRRRLMPVAKKVPLAELIEACRQVYRITGRRITFEYIVLPGVNDRDEDARRLARLTEGLPYKVNLIAFNPVEGMRFHPPSDLEVERFQKKLLEVCRVAVTYRRSHGGDIAGACGQLAGGKTI
ncbi:MAG: 23S rRNA (adenine(2503)-C(2))-methyltransferase RlmN [Candidatus Glassbacteria bacterium]